jgi:riboflavin biosynthesis pyrimidine reductase
MKPYVICHMVSSVDGRIKPGPTPITGIRPIRRNPGFARRDAEAYSVVLDAHGKIAWRCSDIGSDPIVAVLTEQVTDTHLAGLRRDGVSYTFAGGQGLNLELALEMAAA